MTDTPESLHSGAARGAILCFESIGHVLLLALYSSIQSFTCFPLISQVYYLIPPNVKFVSCLIWKTGSLKHNISLKLNVV